MASSRTTSTSGCPGAGGRGRRRSFATLWWYPHGLPHEARGLDVLHCPTFRGPVRSRRPRGSNGPRPRRPTPPGDVQPVDAALQPPCRPQGGAGGEARDRGVRVHARRDRRAARRARRADRRDPERGRARRSPRTARRPRASTCSPSGRWSRARTLPLRSRPRERLGCAAESRGARGWGDVQVEGWLGRVSDDELAALYRGAQLPRLSRRSTRASGSRCWRRWRAGRRSSRAPAARPRRSRAAPRCSSTRTTSRRSRPGSRRRQRGATSCASRGLERAAQFTWERVAAETRRVYEAAAA